MLRTIFRHELSHWLRQPLPYLFGLVLFGISFVTMWGTAGEATGGNNAEVINSSYRLVFMSTYLNNLLLFLLPTIVGAALYRDYKSRMYTVLFSYPITKPAYLIAKFGSAMLIVTLVVLCIGLGFATGALMPGIAPEVIRPFNVWHYFLLYGLFLLPNLLLYGALVFRVVIGTRNVYPAFIAIIIVVIFQALLGSILGNAETEWLANLLDPNGVTAVKSSLKYWTVEERNSSAIPLSGALITNRLLWFSVSIGLCWSAWRKFSFSQFGQPTAKMRSVFRRRRPVGETDDHINSNQSKEVESLPQKTRSVFQKKPLPRGEGLGRGLKRPLVTYNFTPQQSLKTTWHLSNTDFRFITLSWPFAALLAGGFLLVFLQQSQMNPQYGFEIQPTTATMLQIPMFIFSFVINLVTFLYVGVLAYRGQTSRMGDLIDTVPQPAWVLMLSRLLAVLKVQLLLLTIVMVAGILTQFVSGYGRYEIGHYLVELFGLHFIHFLIWACMATFVHTVFRNMYLGFFVLLILPFSFGAIAEIGKFMEWPFLRSGIFQFNAVPGTEIGFPYSDFFGYETGRAYYVAFKSYWFLAGLLLLGGSLLLWKRGYIFSWRERRMQGKLNGKGWLRPTMLFGLTAFLTLSSALYYHDHLGPNQQLSDATYDAALARNELEYGRYLKLPQPRIVKARVDLDLYPEDLRYRAHGTLWFVNKVERPLDTILLAASLKEEGEYTVRNPHALITDDADLNFQVLHLTTPLRKGDTLTLDVDIRNKENGFLKTNDRVKTNGTYLQGFHILPSLGVRNAFLTNADKRAKYGLGDRKVAPQLPSDTTLLGYEFPSNNMGRIDFETTISTSTDQRAFSMGTLVREWKEDNRNHFHYRSKGPIVDNISWLSGRYQTERDTAGAMPLEFHYHYPHGQNIPHIRQGVRASIAYCSEVFGELAHESLKMVEFPNSFGSHATLNGNLIPYSERMLLCDVDHENNEVFNVPFFTGAHEVAHYWWGHRVDPANVAGSRFITEGMADYLAIKITEREYGPEFSREILKLFQELYLRERARRTDEVPLLLAGLEQKYLNYRKASIAFNALSHYLGESTFNRAVAAFEERYRFAPPPFATSYDFAAALRKVTPDSLSYLIEDYFESITLYDNSIDEAQITTLPTGGFLAQISLSTSKYRSDAKGTKTFTDDKGRSLQKENIRSMPLADYLEIGFYVGKRELAVEKVRVDDISKIIRFKLSEAPDRIEVDPNYLLLDADREDGIWRKSDN